VPPLAPGPYNLEAMSWAWLTGTPVLLFLFIAAVIGFPASLIAIVPIVRRHRRTAVESPQRAIQPPTQVNQAPVQVIQPPIVIPSGQVPRDGGAASTFPGPGRTTGTSAFKTWEPGASQEPNLPERAFEPGIKVISEDSAHAEGRP
jgi:hypothetical protein